MSKTHLHAISRKADERNRTVSAELKKPAVKARAPSPSWQPRIPLPGETPPPTLPAWDSTDPNKVYIRTRDNPDTPFRPGAMDFMQHRSHGYRT